MVWSVMRRYGAGCVLACVVLAGGVVVMVSVPFRGGWLVLPGKGTPVHNHPDTKGKTPNFVLGDKQILQLLFFAFVAFFHAFHQATNVVGGTFTFVGFHDVINGAHLVEGAVVNPDCGVAELRQEVIGV